ncbi:MAG: ATP-binding protein [Legionellales bacterium]|nr:ATP-binding protein [Legionellales bacterium]
MTAFNRYLTLDLPQGQSAFLWGARKTGKSFFLKHSFPQSQYYDLLKTEEYWRFLNEPQTLRAEILALPPEKQRYPIIIDEVQKIPQLLNEVHWLIENSNAYFILCGSSARKLKKEGANMLGGRAWRYEFYPLVYPEIPNFDLLRALNQGLIPSHYLATHWHKTIKSYIYDYLTEEIKAEGLTRNLTAFSRFLELAAYSNGEIINFSNIARDCGIDSKTVKEYYHILEDTLLGYFLQPYFHRKKRDHIPVKTPKFYLFDVGVVNGLCKRKIMELKGAQAGAMFEHYIFNEILAYRGLNDLDFTINYWRTQTGQEVDFILDDGEIAIEVKIAESIHKTDLNGLLAFYDYAKPKRSIVVCNVPKPQKLILDEKLQIDILPWEIFLNNLWDKTII